MPKIMRKHFFLFFFLAAAGTCVRPAFADTPTMYETFSRRSETKVFVSIPSDTSEQNVLNTEALKKTLEKTFEERKSIRFKVVPDEAGADIVLDTQIQGFLFSETDPVDMLVGVGAAAMDAAIQDHFASAEALFTVREPKTQKILWSGKVKGSVTDHDMAETESHGMAGERLGQMLMREAFGKKKK